ncbi:MAG TPA: tetratricopeptide repeat protein, partial [Kiloniellaceae bacterium]|nr:tetratricopeptide repeat protein [Kiloniellaceae bacterium]
MASRPSKGDLGAEGDNRGLQAALAAHRAGRLAEAEAGYRQQLARRPGDVQAIHLLGLLCAQSGRLTEATGHLEEVLRLAPDMASAHFALAELLQKQGRHNDAIDAYRSGLALAPENVAAMNNLAGLLREAGDVAAAADCLAAAMRIAPDYAPLHLGLGQLHAQKGEWDAALTAYDSCLGYNPDWPPALFAKAAVYRRLDRNDDALACLETLLQVSPGDIRALESSAMLLRRQGRLTAAAAALRQLLARAPENLEALSDLADVAAALGDADLLLQCHGRILSLAPQDAERWRAFAGAVRLLRIDGYDPRLRDLLLTALSREELDHQDLAVPAVSLLKAAPAGQALLAQSADVDRGPLEGAILAALSEPLLPAVLEQVMIPDAALEAALVTLRQRFLNDALARPAAPVPADVLACAQAMAQQCFLNEYLYGESAEETAALQSWAARLAAAGHPWDDWQALALAVLASY